MSNLPFPMFFDIHSWKILVVGGGTIARRRVGTLMKFDPYIMVAAPSLAGEGPQPEMFCGCIPNPEKFLWFENCFREELLEEDWNLVLACTDDAALNSRIYRLAKAKGIPANNASNQKECDFFFPAIVTGDGLVIGISSDGRDHGKVRETAAKIRREYGE